MPEQKHARKSPKLPWFRLYVETLDDPKVQRLPDDLFKTWINLLCLAAKGDGLLPPDLEDTAFALRLSIDETERRLAALRDFGLFDGDEPHNWSGRQFKSDHDGNERVRRYREKRRNVTRNVTGNGSVTGPEQSRHRAEDSSPRNNLSTRESSVGRDAEVERGDNDAT